MLSIAIRICKSVVFIELWLLYSLMLFTVYRLATFSFTSLYLCRVFRFFFARILSTSAKYITSIVELSYQTRLDSIHGNQDIQLPRYN